MVYYLLFLISEMNRKTIVPFVGLMLFTSVVGADYTYVKSQTCVGDACSTLTCDVTEYDEIVTTTTTTVYEGTELFVNLYDYLIDQDQPLYAAWILELAWSGVCETEGEYSYTTTTSRVPDPTEECNWSLPFCGDSIIDSTTWEECDEGHDVNGLPTSSCTVDCKTKTPATCGDAIVQVLLGEECDPGVPSDYCDENCLFIPDVPKYEVGVNDPVICESPFDGRVVLPEGDTDFARVDAFLEVAADCENYTQLEPIVDLVTWLYIAEVEYFDSTKSNYLVWWSYCVRYGAVVDGMTVFKEDTVHVEWICPVSTTWWSSTGGSTGWSSIGWGWWWSSSWWSSSGWWWGGWGTFTWGTSWGDPTVKSSYSVVSDNPFYPAPDVLDELQSPERGIDPFILSPSADPLTIPIELERTWGYWFW